MTNYEWLVKNKADLVKDVLTTGIAKENGTPKPCKLTHCDDCDFFHRGPGCTNDAKKWLEQEYDPPYKKGDIVVGPFDQIFIVKECYDDDGSINVSSFVDASSGSRMSIAQIKKKICHVDIEESEV